MSKQYILHVCIGDDEQLVDIGDKLVFGSAPESDVNLEAPDINPKHLIFRVNNGVLTVRNNSLDSNTKLGKTALKPKKMVILDAGDVITIGDLQLKISTESDEEEVTTSTEDLPTATTLFKLAKAELDEEENTVDDDEALDELVDSEESTGEYDVDELFAPAPEEPKKRGFSFLNIFKRKKKVEDIDDSEEYIEEDIEEASENIDADNEATEDHEQERDTAPKTSWFKKLFQRKNKKGENTDHTPDPRVKTIEDSKPEHDPAKRSFIQKLLYKLKFKKRGIKAPIVKAVKEKIPPTSFVSRLYALMFSYTLAYTIYSYFTEQINNYLHHPELIKLLNHPEITKVLTLIKPYWHKVPTEIMFYIEKIYPIFLIVILLDILSSLIFAAPLPLIILGVHTTGNFVIKRVQAVIKSILGIFHPLIIFDLPLLVAQPTLKELITASRYGRLQNKIRTGIGHILIAFLIVILLALPLLLDLIPPNNLPVQQNKQILVTRNRDPENVYTSRKFNFKLTDINNDTFSIPLNYDQKRQQFTITTFFHAQTVQLKIEPFDIKPIEKLHKALQLNNPIYNFITKDKSIDLETEIKTILQLNLEPNSIFNFIKLFGPLITPAYKYKQRLLKLFNITKIDAIQFLAGTSNFIKIIEGKHIHMLHVVPPYLHIHYQMNTHNQSLANQLPSLMFANFKRLPPKQNNISVISFDNRLDPFTYLDIVLTKKEDAIQHIYELYRTTLLKIAEENKTIPQILLQKKMESFKKLHLKLCPTCLTPQKELIQNTNPKVPDKKEKQLDIVKTSKRVKDRKNKQKRSKKRK